MRLCSAETPDENESKAKHSQCQDQLAIQAHVQCLRIAQTLCCSRYYHCYPLCEAQTTLNMEMILSLAPVALALAVSLFASIGLSGTLQKLDAGCL